MAKRPTRRSSTARGSHRRQRSVDILRVRPQPPKKSHLLRNVIVIIAGLGFVGALPFIWMNSPTPGKMVKRAEPRQEHPGKSDYDEFCGYCHGFELDGVSSWFAPTDKDPVKAPRLDGLGNTWKLSDKMLFNITRNGGQAAAAPGVTSDMPAFADVLTDHKIRSILLYIETFWSDDIRKRRAQRAN